MNVLNTKILLVIAGLLATIAGSLAWLTTRAAMIDATPITEHQKIQRKLKATPLPPAMSADSIKNERIP
jgi:hypothetical protein